MIKRWFEKLGIHLHHFCYRGRREISVRIGRGTIALERYYLSNAKHLHIGVDLGCSDTDREIVLSLGVKRLFDFYLSFDHPWLERITPGTMRESTIYPGKVFKMARKTFIGVRIFDQGIWVSLWENTMESSCSDPWWWAFNVHPLDILLGSEEYRSTLHHFEETAVALPERIYPVRVSFYDRVWKRARWPFAKKIRQAEIGLPRPIPVPGKGESSWDMDDDAVCSMSIPAMTLDDAILALLNSVNKARVRYGGPAWVPVTQMELEN